MIAVNKRRDFHGFTKGKETEIKGLYSLCESYDLF